MKIDRYRLIYIGLGALAIAVIALAVAFGSPEGRGTPRPEVIESISPQPGDLVPRQTWIEIDLKTGYEVEIWVDGFRLPENEISAEPAIGVYRWRPGPGRVFETLTPGPHEVEIRWSRTVGLADVGRWSWTFRTY